MNTPDTHAGSGTDALETQISSWREHLRQSRAIGRPDADELEDHLREQIVSLGEAGLSADEAFLVAVKRMGSLDALTREFAREHSERLWKQLVLAGDDAAGRLGGASGAGLRKMWAALLLAVAAAAAIKVPSLFGLTVGDDPTLFYASNISFFTLPFIAAWFAWERPVDRRGRLLIAGLFAGAAVLANAYAFPPVPGGAEPSDTHLLLILHLPLTLWFVVGLAYAGGDWAGSERRMDFVRFTGEAFIYYVLFALGGGVLMGVTFGLFEAIGIDVEPVVEQWVLPCGVVGATVIAAWLVEGKQSVIENMAPVLARVFSPLFGLLLMVFVATMVVTGQGIATDREILIVVDLLLVVVFGLLLYTISARDPLAPPDAMDWIQLGLVAMALLVDSMALWAIGSRISDFGFTPNRLAALGMNLVLLVNLGVSAAFYLAFIRGQGPYTRLGAWQTRYLYVIAAWAAVVAIAFPPFFGFR